MIEQEVLNEFKGKRCLVTGGSGMIGRQVVDILCAAGAEVTVVSLDVLHLNAQATYLYGDLTDFGYCLRITEDMDYCFNIAGIKGSPQLTAEKPASFFVPLMQMNTNMLEACRQNGIGKVLYTSSIGAYPVGAEEVLVEHGNYDVAPMDRFPGYAKRMGELQVMTYRQQYGLHNFAIVRPTNCFGPGDNFDPDTAMVVGSLMGKIARGDDPVIVWGDGSAVRDFTFSRDIAEGMILAIHYGTYYQTIPGGGTYYVNLGSGKGYSVKELVETLQSFIEFNYEFDTSMPAGFPRRVMDIHLAKNLIHYNPTTILRDGLQETWDWFLENKGEYLSKKNYFEDE